MYTDCPSCGQRHLVRAEDLRAAAGRVRCARCGATFDALARLVDQPAGAGGAGASGRGDGKAMPALRPPGGRGGSGGAVAGEPRAAGASRAARLPAPPRALRWLPGDLTLALRNLTRQRRRTALALSAIGFGVITLLLAGGFIEWIFWAMREATIGAQLGHAQVMRRGYHERGVADPFAFILPDTSPARSALEGLPGVKALAPRLAFSGLAGFGETTVSFLAEGVDPEREEAGAEHVHITGGEPLAGDDPQGAILGQGLARNLGVEVGDTVVLLASTGSGGINAVEVRVRGLFFTSNKAFDDTALRVPIGLARELLRVEGSHLWVVLLDDTARTDTFVDAARAIVARADPDLTVVPWHELADFYNKTVRVFSAQMDLVRAVVGLLIVLGISNVLVMSVLDRTAEVGTLMALGLRRGKVLRLFLAEGVLLGALGGTLGLGLGYGLALGISAVGIPMPPPPGMDVAFTGAIRVTPGLAIGTWALATATTLLASVYPAWKASRLEIVDALRHGR